MHYIRSHIKKLSNARMPILVLALVLLVAAAGTLVPRAIDTRLFALSTSYQPEAFTELYFTWPQRLPTTTVAGHEYDVSFSVVSHETTRTTYTYQVLLTDSAGVRQLTTGNATLDSGEQMHKKFYFTASTTDKAIISVTLLPGNQTIQFTAKQL